MQITEEETLEALVHIFEVLLSHEAMHNNVSVEDLASRVKELPPLIQSTMLIRNEVVRRHNDMIEKIEKERLQPQGEEAAPE